MTHQMDDLDRGQTGTDGFEIIEPRASALVQSMRAVGYTPQAAIADLVDNSLSARARNVWLTFFWDGPNSFAAVRDDGRGMTATALSDAMRLGSRSPMEEREPDDLGRFGLGLKTASFSQCRRLTVRSRQREGAEATRRWDLDYVTATDQWRLLTSAAPGSEARLDGLVGLSSGTIVLWEVMDRLVGAAPVGDSKAQRRFLDLTHSIEEHLAMIFHRFLVDRSRLSLWINGSRVDAWDPFLSTESATQRLAEESLGVNASRIIVRPYVLPHHSKIPSEVHRRGAGPSGWNAQQGFYIYRNRRLLVAGDWLRLGFEKEEHCKLARIQVDLPNAVDDAWSIDVKKSTARPPGPLREEFKRIAAVTRQRASDVYRHRGKVIARATSQEYAFLWSKVVRHGRISYRVNRDHPLVKATMSELGPRREAVEMLLRTVEETIPAPMIALDLSQSPDSTAIPFEGAETSEVLTVLARIYGVLREDGLSDQEARARLLGMEPFDHFPELVASFDREHGQ
jgi:Histidine kinase-, DNA gyrase B-, and HSP90-like ATPase